MHVAVRADYRAENYANQASECEDVPKAMSVAYQQHRLSNEQTGKHRWNETYCVSAHD